MLSKTKILSIFPGRLSDIRGTPVRVGNLIKIISSHKDVECSVVSYDTESIPGVNNILLSPTQNFVNYFKIINLIRKNNIDLVVAHTISRELYTVAIKLFTKAKVVLEMHGFPVQENMLYYPDYARTRGILKRVYYLLKYNLLVRIQSLAAFYFSDLITTCSQTAAEEVSKYNKMTIPIYGGVDLNIFNEQAQSLGFFKKEGIIIGYAGNFRLWQGVDFLLEVFKELVGEYPEFKLKILTSEQPASADIHPNVEILKAVPQKNVPGFLVDCDILVIPRLENEVNRLSFASKLPEYMAMGKAVVASKTSDAHKIIQDGITGLLYEPGDKDGLKNCFLRLRDEQLRKQLGTNAVDYVKRELSWEKQGQIFFDSLSKLMHS